MKAKSSVGTSQIKGFNESAQNQNTSENHTGKRSDFLQEWFVRCPKASGLLEALEQCSSLRDFLGGKNVSDARLIEKLLARWKEDGRPEIAWHQSSRPISDETYEEILNRLLS
jgi:hypothetical protein